MRVRASISMEDETLARLDELASELGLKRSAYVSWLVNSAWNASRKQDYETILSDVANLINEAGNAGK